MSKKDTKQKSHKHKGFLNKYVKVITIYVLIALIVIVPAGLFLLKGSASVVHVLQKTYTMNSSDLKVDTKSYKECSIEVGDVEFVKPKIAEKYGQITSNDFNLDVSVFYDTNRVCLRNGAGTVPNAESLPGQEENTLIYATRKYFDDLDSAEEGDNITLKTTWGTYSYTVVDKQVTKYSNLEYPYDQCLIISTSATNKPFSFDQKEKLYIVAQMDKGPSAREVLSE